MKTKKNTVFVTDGSLKATSDVLQGGTESKIEKLKKPIIFALMGIVFLGSMYMIFKPSGNKKKTEDIGLNDSVPQATDIGLQDDKQKAYEQEILEQKNQEKQNTLTSLSDYWNENSTDETAQDVSEVNNETYNSL